MPLALLLLAGGARSAIADDKSDEYRLTVFPTYALTEDKRWIGIGYIGYVENPEDNYQTDYLGLGTIRRIQEWAEIWTVLLNVRTNQPRTHGVSLSRARRTGQRHGVLSFSQSPGS
ncbi:MAG TPA: hypothetical protein VIT67_20955 [Povalibacter sp.]